MAPSTSSFLDLKAQLAKQEVEFAQIRALGKETIIRGGVKRPDKKPAIWARPNKGVASRNVRDLEWSLTSKPTLETAQNALGRKVAQYEKLKKGKTAGLSEKQYDSLLVDFDRKAENEDYDSDGRDLDESLIVHMDVNEDDPIVEYEDEFGRMRTARRSEVPRNLQQPVEKDSEPEDDPYLIRGGANYFPTYEQSAEKIAAIEAAVKEYSNTATHYDATGEVRPRGAGFYQFSKDEETRQRQMEELRQSRMETGRAREESGAAGRKGFWPGLDKRKREIEGRRKAIEAKRRKVRDTSTMPSSNDSVVVATNTKGTGTCSIPVVSKPNNPDPKPGKLQSADDSLGNLERDIMAAGGVLNNSLSR